MQRLPVDGKKVVEHRITLGTKERQLLGDAVPRHNCNRSITPIFDLMKEVSGRAALYILLNSLFPRWADGLNLDELDGRDNKGIFDYFETQNIVLSAAGVGLTGLLTGGLGFGAIFAGVLFGQAAAEGGEAAVGYTQDVIDAFKASQKPEQAVFLMLQLRRSYKKIYDD